MSDSGVEVFLSLVSNYYATLKDPAGAAKLREEMKQFLLQQFQHEIDSKVLRMVEQGAFGPLPTFLEFVKT